MGLLGGRLPSDLRDVVAEGEEAVVLAAVAAHLDELAAVLHVGQAVLGWGKRRETQGYVSQVLVWLCIDWLSI